MNRDKIRGMFLGIAIGDALFMPVETYDADKIRSLHGRINRYLEPPFAHKWHKDTKHSGAWTDDTQLTLAVADSLIEYRGFNMDDLAQRHVDYYRREGDRGFGATTRNAIKRIESGVHWSDSGKTNNPRHGRGNGLPMKIAPLGAMDCQLIQGCDFACMTHYTYLGVESALAHMNAIHACLHSNAIGTRTEIIDTFVASFRKLQTEKISNRYLQEHFPSIKMGDKSLLEALLMLRHLPLEKMSAEDFIKLFGGGSTYVYHSLLFSYAFFLRDPFSIETLYDVGNAGGDTDTNASIVGGMLGALNGTSIFPQHLIDGLWQKDRIINTAERFCDTFCPES